MKDLVINLLEEDIDRVLFEFLELPVSVTFTKAFDEYNFEDVSIPSCDKGTIESIPLFLAEILYKDGIIENFWDNLSISLTDINRAFKLEVRSGELQETKESQLLLAQRRMEKSPETYSEIDCEKISSFYKKIVDTRLPKVVNLSSMGTQRGRNFAFNSTEEVLHQYLHELISAWKKKIG